MGESLDLDEGDCWSFYIKDIDETIFTEFLHFLYTGELAQKNMEHCTVLKQLGTEFNVPSLITYVENMENELGELNPSIATWLVDRSAELSKKIFFQKSDLADFSITIEGQSFPLHTIFVSSRCEVLKAMLKYANHQEKNLKLEDAKIDTFMIFLEFLYTSHMPEFEDEKLFELLLLADQFQSPRLVSWCEYLFTKVIERKCEQTIEHADFDVIALLNTCSRCNAEQLEAWCLHFISSNYGPMSKRQEFEEGLQQKHREYIEEHQWPPKSYYNDLEVFEQELEAYNKKYGKSTDGEKCSIM